MVEGSEKWSGTSVLPRVSPGPRPGGLLSSSCPHNGDPDGCCPRCLLLDRQASLLFLFRVAELVGDGGNAPLVVFRPSLATAVLRTAGRIITRVNWWRQWELHPPQTVCKTVSPLRHMGPRNWHGVPVLPRPRQVLGTRLRKLAPAVLENWCARRESHPRLRVGNAVFCY